MTRFKDYRLVEYRKDQTSIDQRLRLLVGDGRLKGVYNYNVGFIDSEGGVQQPCDTDGRIRVAQTDSQTFSSNDPATPVAVDMIVTAGETWEILDILARLDADGNAANRVFSVNIAPLSGFATAGPVVMWETQTITATANQFAAFWLPMSRNGYYYIDTNGVATLSTALDNPLPFRLNGPGQVTTATTLGQATDELSLRVLYRKVSA